MVNPHDIAAQFRVPAGKLQIVPYGNGHINRTYLVTIEGCTQRFILQQLNRYVFPHPEEVMENIIHVTGYLRQEILRAGGDPDRESMTLIPTAADGYYVLDADGEVWRMYLFIEDTISRDLPDTEALFEASGSAFGKFQQQLSGFPAETLHEPIHDFHNTRARYEQLMSAIAGDKAGRLAQVSPEIEFCRRHQAEASQLVEAIENGTLPLRVTHNDTKLNNVLLDSQTGEGVCVIDLDTVMPGLAAYDFGDSIRFGANTALEDETDLSKVSLSLPMYTAFARGFLRQAGSMMNAEERHSLPLGAKLMTLECGMRFLADYLNGDVYFKIHRPNHNLDRARTQFALVRDMEANWEEMNRIIDTL